MFNIYLTLIVKLSLSDRVERAGRTWVWARKTSNQLHSGKQPLFEHLLVPRRGTAEDSSPTPVGALELGHSML